MPVLFWSAPDHDRPAPTLKALKTGAARGGLVLFAIVAYENRSAQQPRGVKLERNSYDEKPRKEARDKKETMIQAIRESEVSRSLKQVTGFCSQLFWESTLRG